MRLFTYVTEDEGVGIFWTPLWEGLITLSRVIVLVIVATLVWVPIGVRIGLNPRLARIAQPLVQILASFPANFLFPFATYAFIKTGLSPQHRRHPAHEPGRPVVHPVQHHRRGHGHPDPTSRKRWTTSACAAGNGGAA